MANYPRVDADNPYLLARFDGAIVDGKPWGKGGNSCEDRQYPWGSYDPRVCVIKPTYGISAFWERALCVSQRLGESTSLQPILQNCASKTVAVILVWVCGSEYAWLTRSPETIRFLRQALLHVSMIYFQCGIFFLAFVLVILQERVMQLCFGPWRLTLVWWKSIIRLRWVSLQITPPKGANPMSVRSSLFVFLYNFADHGECMSHRVLIISSSSSRQTSVCVLFVTQLRLHMMFQIFMVPKEKCCGDASLMCCAGEMVGPGFIRNSVKQTHLTWSTVSWHVSVWLSLFGVAVQAGLICRLAK